MSEFFARYLIIHPYSTFKKVWDIFVGIITFACTLIIPFSLALSLEKQSEFSDSLWYFDTFTTCVFLLDIGIAFRTAYTTEFDQVLITNPRQMALHYLRSREFVVDVISAIPVFIVGANNINQLTKLFAFSRFIRVLKLFKQWNRLSWFISHSLGTDYSQLLSIFFWLPVILHIFSCGWLWITGIVYDEQIVIHYVQALYWCTTTITTIGYGDITPDRNNVLALSYTMLVQITGAALYGFSIGNIANVLAKRDAAKVHHLEKMDRINAFLRYRDIPPVLQTRIRNYFSYIWLTRRGYDENSVLDELPANIKIEVSLHLKRELLEKVELFRTSSDGLKREIALNMQSVLYLPEEIIVNYGDIGEEMYFISRGKVAVLSGDLQTTYAILCEGSFFGEIALLKETVRTATVRAIEYCDLYSLNKTTFDKIITRYPDFASYIQNAAEQRKNN